MDIWVHKYGGAAVSSIEKLESVADHIVATQAQGKRLVVTISAMGEETDKLMALANQINQSPPKRELDMLLTAGERVSMALLSMALAKRGVDAQSLTGSQCGILTDAVHGNARIREIRGDRIKEGLQSNRVVIVAGFQGVNPETREVTTLGRGGTDLSAIALAGILGAKRCCLFKDVDGILTADPRVVANPRLISKLHWKTMDRLARSGAKVLHARGAHLAQKMGVPFEICPSADPFRSGTIVDGSCIMESSQIIAVSQIQNLVLVKFEWSKDGEDPVSLLRKELWKNEDCQPWIKYSEIGSKRYCEILIKKENLNLVKERSNDLVIDEMLEDLGLITVVGTGFFQEESLVSQVVGQCTKAVRVDVQNDAISAVVPSSDLERTLQSIHGLII